MNILQTLHPPDKDYGLMKIDEPKTPYSYSHDDGDGASSVGCLSNIDPELIAKMASKASKVLIPPDEEEEDEEEEEQEELTEEEIKRRREFEIKRKMHYNEYEAVKLARKLLEEEDEDDGESKDNNREAEVNDADFEDDQPVLEEGLDIEDIVDEAEQLKDV